MSSLNISSETVKPNVMDVGNVAAQGRPHIVHIIHRFGVGGLENGLVNLLNGMQAQKFRHTIVCLTVADGFEKRLTTTIKVIELGKRKGKDPASYWRLWKLLRKLKPEIVHTRNLGTLDCQIVAWLSLVPVRIHGEHGWDTYDLQGSSKKYLRLRRLMRFFVHRYVPMSKHLEHWLTSKVRISQKKIGQIYNGVDTERFKPLAQQPRSKIEFAIGTVGRLHSIKDQATLIRAFAKFSAAYAKPCRLILVGAGPMEKSLYQLASELQISRQVEFVGESQEIPGQLRRMDLFVLPSLNEGISNTILEAMATALPVVATDVGGNPELVQDGKIGSLVPVADVQALTTAMLIYARDTERCRREGKAGRELVCNQFSLTKMLHNYTRLYTSVLN